MPNNNVKDIKAADFDQEVLMSDQPVVVEFWAAWSDPCKELIPHLDSLAEEYSGKAKVYRVDAEEAAGLAMRFAVQTVPTVLVFRGGSVVAQHQGGCGKADLERVLKLAF